MLVRCHLFQLEDLIPESEIDREAMKYLTKMKVVKARKGLKNNQDRFELTYDPQTSRLEEKQ